MNNEKQPHRGLERLPDATKPERDSHAGALRSSPSISDRARDALTILEGAASLAKKWFDQGITEIQTKSDGSPVSQADRDVETYLRQSLKQAFPDDGILGEEYPEHKGTSGSRWIIDPIDGTKSFIHGIPTYATLIAYEQQGEIDFGAIALPSLSQTVHAERGTGCWSNGKPAHVSQTKNLDGAHVMATWLEDWDLQTIARLQQKGVILRTWGDAYGYSLVATGCVDAIVDHTVQIYDLAPMPVIIEEAGGRFTSKTGQRTINQGNAVASNAILHNSILTLVEGE